MRAGYRESIENRFRNRSRNRIRYRFRLGTEPRRRSGPREAFWSPGYETGRFAPARKSPSSPVCASQKLFSFGVDRIIDGLRSPWAAAKADGSEPGAGA